MISLLTWLCKKTGHLIRKEWEEKSQGIYDHCQICGTLIKKEKRDGRRDIRENN